MTRYLILIITMTWFNPSLQFLFGSAGGCGAARQSCGCSPQPACGGCAASYRHSPPAPYIAPQQVYVAPQSYAIPQANQDYQTAPAKQQIYIKPTSRVTPEVGYTDRNTPLIIEKSIKSLTTDPDQDALSTFESTLETYKKESRGGLRRREAKKQTDINDDEKCSSVTLRKIIMEAMSDNVSVSKLRISQRAKKAFGYNFDVICSEHDFSYLISSNIHCRVQRFGLYCLAYEN